MTKKIVWRLSSRPTVDEIHLLVSDKTITQDEAREILFTKEEVTERDKKSLESEIKFLRELIDKLSTQSKIVETIRVIEKHYNNYPWYQPYYYWQNGTMPYYGNSICGATTLSNTQTNLVGSGNNLSNAVSCSFSGIQTF